ncbi:MAG: hypothetical protein A2X13_04095 [Bacteroidetes bacterium GWC2_33_15]|nr:MAG: hypothetical protein A2X10_00860 [Bacteroidetes bacterium GWA2_33_15]OFX49755.1 MAG: hypothetical protein A2X13_04095 [Bacteroidetes bacterium GWC2_33_15]OFX66122.1 MAG: hypothetical protein A2X15_10740 [Bacteroidetes bacterium GWB2_32_14]OFX68397.1 MAG: hypothetical protein A2X14_08155 [Bacteroidetes bacterium GWD2_33_33]
MLFSSFNNYNGETCSLTIEVNELRNSKGVVQFALYNKDGSLPDENYVRCYKILKGEIINNSSVATFENIPAGIYAVNILHDENTNGKIDRTLILPKEGIGFSNYESIGLSNIPKFAKASINLKDDLKIKVKIIYM